MRQIQPLLGTRRTYVEQSPLFFEVNPFLRRFSQRKETFFEAGYEYDGEFEALRGVKGHQRDLAFVIIRFVDVGDERDLLQERRQGSMGGISRRVFRDGVQKLLDVLPAHQVFGRLLLFQVVDDAGFLY